MINIFKEYLYISLKYIIFAPRKQDKTWKRKVSPQRQEKRSSERKPTTIMYAIAHHALSVSIAYIAFSAVTHRMTGSTSIASTSTIPRCNVLTVRYSARTSLSACQQAFPTSTITCQDVSSEPSSIISSTSTPASATTNTITEVGPSLLTWNATFDRPSRTTAGQKSQPSMDS